MKRWFSANKVYIIGAFVGAVAGYLYYHKIGCISGTCIITSKPINSTIYGAVMGSLIFSMFKNETKNKGLKKQDNLEDDV